MRKSLPILTLISAITLISCTPIINSSSENSNSSSSELSSSSQENSTSTSEDSSSEESSSESSNSSENSSSSEIVQNKTDVISIPNITSGIVPTSYTSSGVIFNTENISLFGNYIANDYEVSVNIDYHDVIFLKERKQGVIYNLNPLNNIKKIVLKDVIGTGLKLYGSSTSNNDWEEINETELNTYKFSEKYHFFKIENHGIQQVGINEIIVEFESSEEPTINPYIIKNVETLKTVDQTEPLITVSSEPFLNTSYWQEQGYARDINVGQANTKNKDQSGFNGFADYLIATNENVVYDNHMLAYRVANMEYGDNGNSFRINMLDENKVGPVIYKDCVYTFVEDIAAYIVAFGDVPPNMRYSRNNPSAALRDWGINGRVNYTSYNNDNSHKFLFETMVSLNRYYFDPAANTQNYYYNYFESDYGASTANIEPYQQKSGYSLDKYNDGDFIARGALRFVWSYSFTDKPHSRKIKDKIENSFDRNVFFTSNHYNDFQQYLNYYGGWSYRFGNTTLGNPWDAYVKENHLKIGPEIPLTSLENLRK